MDKQARVSDSTDILDILIVEDDSDTRENLRDILELHDHRVALQSTFTEALDRGDLSDFDLIILDRKLPDGMAEERLPMFRTRAPDADLIVVTGYADTQASIAALRGGVTDYLIKPIHPEAFIRSLQPIARRREVERELQKEHQFAEMVLQTAEAIILTLDTNGKITRSFPNVSAKECVAFSTRRSRHSKPAAS